MQIEKRFPLQEVVARLGILDSVANQHLLKDARSIANVDLYFPHLVREDQLESISIVKDVSLSNKPIPDFWFYTAWMSRKLKYALI